MTQQEYTAQRWLWANRLLNIPSPKLFPRTIRFHLLMIAKLDAQYLNVPIEECLRKAEKEFNQYPKIQ